MRSVFGKLLIWFLLTVGVSGTGFVFSTVANLASSTESRQPPFGMLLTLQLNEARSAWERGGAAQLTETLDRFRGLMRGECYLADREGRDLATGSDLRPLIRAVQQRSRWSIFGREEIGFVRQSPDGQYWYLLYIHRRHWVGWFFSFGHLWIFATVLMLCYAFALHLTWPLRRIQDAVDRFGRGDLAARADTRRRDELGDLAQTFNRMADRIQTLLAAERRLLLDISHELRSPLARLGLAVELARSGDDRDEALNRIQKEADRVNLLVTELLQVTRVEGDPSQLKLEPMALDQIARTVVEDAMVEAHARGSTVTLEAPPQATLRGDPELIRRALDNVVRNAVRYAPRGTSVEVKVSCDGSSAVVQVRDYGPGVPEDALGHIFDPFYRVETDRNRAGGGGVGLGLAIARRAVELHRGAIRAWNENPGLRVEIRIPHDVAGCGEAKK